jgi:hypothetical protein
MPHSFDKKDNPVNKDLNYHTGYFYIGKEFAFTKSLVRNGY